MRKVLVVTLLLILLVVGWGAGLKVMSNADAVVDTQTYIDLALGQETMEAYGVAVQSREYLTQVEPTPDNYFNLAMAYKAAERTTKYKATLTEMISMFPTDARAYVELAEYYSVHNSAQDCVDIVESAAYAGIRNAVLDNLYYSNAFKFETIGVGFDEAYRFYGSTALVLLNENYYYVSDGMDILFGGYADASSMLQTVAGIKDQNGECYFVSSGGIKHMDSWTEYDSLYSFNENLALTVLDGKYRYLTTKNQYVFDEYDQATLFAGGIAAVRVGEEWKLMNMQGQVVGDPKKSYKDVLIDEDNICSRQNRIFVSEGKGYYMIDTAGNRIGEDVYEDAEPFYNAPYAAVKVDGKWGFIDINGSVLIAPKYEDARSFGGDIAAVKMDGLWGFVTTRNRMVIEPQFEDAKNFGSNGIAPVKRNGEWGYIELIVKQ